MEYKCQELECPDTKSVTKLNSLTSNEVGDSGN
jgi:hypothetical protein